MPKFLTSIDQTNQRLINLADPTSLTDAATKQYVDNLIAGLSWKDEVRVGTTTNGTLATAYANGQTIDGAVLATGNRILLKDQTTQTENGIYTVNASGAPTRSTDADATAELNNATVFITDGTVNTGRIYTQTTKNPTIGSSNIVWAQFAAGVTYTAGNGLQLSSNVFSVLLDTNPGLAVSGTGLKIAGSFAGNGLQIVSGVESILLDTASGLVVSGTGLKIDTSVVTRKFSTSIGDGSTNPLTVTHSLGTKDITWSLRANSDDSFQYPDVVSTSTTQATFTFAVIPTTNQYRVTILG